jgi:cytochrome c5
MDSFTKPHFHQQAFQFVHRAWAIIVLSTLFSGPGLAAATTATAPGERSGRQVVDATCAACHSIGKDGAPKIGDRNAWSKLASRGLTNLTASALAGIRKMPAHGGSPEASDLEISRAIAYMVNQSGGKWVEPVGKAAPATKGAPTERSGQKVVQIQCGTCHLTGEAGAPKIGDRTAWVQRLKRGMNELVRSAFNGHGAMPARGGMADITENEMRSAITYMFNPASANPLPVVASAPVAHDPNHKIVGDTEIFVGIASAESIRNAQKSRGAASVTNIPEGESYYHVNVTLSDRTSKAPVTNAEVEVRVEDLMSRGESKPLNVETTSHANVRVEDISTFRSLEMMAINQAISYGGFFQMPIKGRYNIRVKVQRPGTTQPVEAKFEYLRN